MARKRQSLLFTVMLLLASCRKDVPINKTNPPDDPDAKYIACLDAVMHNSPSFGALYKGRITTHCPGTPSYRVADSVCYNYPCINPVNPVQICYRKTNIATGEFELWIYDLCAGKGNKIADNMSYGVDWSSTGWIIYTGKDNNLWKVKSTGDSLTQLTTTGGHQNDARWSPDGTKYVWEDLSTGVSHINVAYADGTLIKQIVPMDAYAWLNNNEIIYAREYAPFKIRKYSLADQSITEICSVNSGRAGRICIKVKNDETVIYVDGSETGLNKIDLKSKVVQVIDSTYESYYGAFYSVAANKLILQRAIVAKDIKDQCLLNFWYYLSIMNADGSGERKLILP